MPRWTDMEDGWMDMACHASSIKHGSGRDGGTARPHGACDEVAADVSSWVAWKHAVAAAVVAFFISVVQPPLYIF